MKNQISLKYFLFLVAFFVLDSCSPLALHAQASATAEQTLALSVFGGANGTYTGLASGKNVGITAGVDLRILSYRGFLPSLEVRGTYPVHTGLVDAQKNVLAGLKVEHRIFGDRIHPYADILYGRGEVEYESGGYPSPDGRLIYSYSDSGVLSPGVGVDLDATHYFALKLDAQLQRYDVPVTTSGTLYAKALTAAVVYRFDFNQRFRKNR